MSLTALVLGLGLIGCGQGETEGDAAEQPAQVTPTVDSLAGVLLDTTRSQEGREALISDHPDKAVALVKAMTDDITPGTEEEYSRIPWIWRVSIALGERNNADEIRRLLEVSLPGSDEPLLEWQSVVVGGGIINGISRHGGWPKRRVENIIGDDQELMDRWSRANDLASKMADNEEVAYPYRYDALRMIAMNPWKESSDQLIKYLSGDFDAQLQMGSISGLSDMRSSNVPQVLVEHFGAISTDRNRELALDALMRTTDRRMALVDAVEGGTISEDVLGEDRIKQLQNSSNAELKKRAAEVFGS